MSVTRRAFALLMGDALPLGGLLLQVFEIHVGKELVIVIVILLEQSLVLGRGGVYGRLRD